MAKRLTSPEDRLSPDTPSAETTSPHVRRSRINRLRKFEELVWFVLAVLMVVLSIRFFLLLVGSRTGVPFVDFWYNLSAPLITPFAGMFGTINTYNTYTGMRLELESLVAMLVYGLIGYLVILAIRLLKRT